MLLFPTERRLIKGKNMLTALTGFGHTEPIRAILKPTKASKRMKQGLIAVLDNQT